MATKIGELFATLSVDDKDFKQGVDQSGSSMSGWASKVGGAMATAAAAAGTALATVGAASAKMAVDFQASMLNVQSLLGKEATDRVNQLGEDVKRLSTETGLSLDSMADGIYEVISAWGDSEDTAQILEISAKAAAAGLATTKDAVELLSGVTRGYGDTSAEAVQKVADLAFQTTNLGQTTFPELARSIGVVVPLAKASGTSMEEMFGAMATLTGVTGNTSEVATQLRATLQALLVPTKDMSEAMKAVGFESGKTAIEQYGLNEVLQRLGAHTKGDTEQLAKMFSSIEAINAVLALTGAQAGEFTSRIQAMEEAQGASTIAFEIQQQSVKAMTDRLKASLQVVGVELGEQFLPLLQSLLEWVMQYLPQIQAFFEVAFQAIGAVLSQTGAAFTWFVENIWQPLLEGWETGNTDMQTDWQSTGAWIGSVARSIWEIIKSLVDLAIELWDRWGSTITAVAKSVWEGIKAVISGALEIIKGVLNVFVGFFTGDWNRMKEGISQIWRGLWDGMQGLLRAQWGIVSAILGGFWENFKQNFRAMIEIMKSIGKDIMRGFINGIESLMASIRQKVEAFVQSIKNKIKSVMGISSPSKVMFEIGQNVGLGLAGGIENTRKTVQKATDAIMPGVSGGIPLPDAARASGGATAAPSMMTVVLSLDGRDIARTVMPYLPGELMRIGVMT